MERFAGPHTEGFFYQLVMSGTHAADSMGTAFPSSHVVGAVAVAALATRLFSRTWAVLFVLGALGVVLSTVYTQGHFAIDSLAGIVFALVVTLLIAPPLERMLRAWRRPSRAGEAPASPTADG